MKRWLVLIVLFAACSGGGGHAAASEEVSRCRDAVRQDLATAATLTFDGGGSAKTSTVGDSVGVYGHVSAQDGGSGGTPRTTSYSCLVSKSNKSASGVTGVVEGQYADLASSALFP